jgi:hypothetical protein
VNRRAEVISNEHQPSERAGERERARESARERGGEREEAYEVAVSEVIK